MLRKSISEKFGKGSFGLIGLGLALLMFSGSFVIIPTGFTGVRSTFSQIEEKSLPNGFQWKTPFVQDVIKVNNKKQDITMATESAIEGASSEKVKIYVRGIRITYRIESDKSAYLLSTFSGYDNGDALLSGLAEPAVKAATYKLTAEENSDRTLLQPRIKESLQTSVNEKYGEGVISIEAVNIENTSAEDSYNEKITARNNAEIERQTQGTENQRKLELAETTAAEKRILTEAEATARILEAESIAKANEYLEKSLTEKILASEMIEKWDGKYPLVMSSDGSMMLDINTLLKENGVSTVTE